MIPVAVVNNHLHASEFLDYRVRGSLSKMVFFNEYYIQIGKFPGSDNQELDIVVAVERLYRRVR